MVSVVYERYPGRAVDGPCEHCANTARFETCEQTLAPISRRYRDARWTVLWGRRIEAIVCGTSGRTAAGWGQ